MREPSGRDLGFGLSLLVIWIFLLPFVWAVFGGWILRLGGAFIATALIFSIEGAVWKVLNFPFWAFSTLRRLLHIPTGGPVGGIRIPEKSRRPCVGPGVKSATGADLSGLMAGDRVVHKVCGEGRIQSVQHHLINGSLKWTATVYFESIDPALFVLEEGPLDRP